VFSSLPLPAAAPSSQRPRRGDQPAAQDFDLAQKLGRECRFAPNTVISRIAVGMQVYITDALLRRVGEHHRLFV
jgi:hypothetical protein